MIPVQLKIKGLNSFLEEQSIDFTKLTSAGLFGIFGQTGSGKSTIIDAITLALFAEMSRYDKRNISKQFINVNCNEAMVCFRFKLGEKLYEVTRAFKNKAKTVEQYIHKLAYIEGEAITVLEDTISDLNRAIVNLLGLTYDDFQRSVILPQGKFSEVLLIENKERRDMLQRIFRLDEYGDRLYRKILDESKISKHDVSILENDISHYKDITKENLESNIELYKNETVILNELKLKLEQSSKFLLKQTELLNIKNEIEQLNEKLKHCERYESVVNDKTIILEKSSKVDILKPDIDTLQKVLKDLEMSSKSLEEIDKVYSHCIEKENELDLLYKKVVEEKAKEVPKLIEKEMNLKQALKISEQINETKKIIDQLTKDYKEKKADLKHIVGEKEELLCAKKNQESEIDALMKRRAEINDQLQQRDKVSELYYFHAELERMKESGNFLIKKLNAEKSEYKALSLDYINISKVYEEEKAKLQKLNENNSIMIAVSMLEDGEPCPVCGSLDHKYSKNTSYQGEDYTNLKYRVKLTESKEKSEIRLNKLNLEKAVKEERISGIEAELNKIRNEIELKLKNQKTDLSFDEISSKFEQMKNLDNEKINMESKEAGIRKIILQIEKKLEKSENQGFNLQKELEGIYVSGKEKTEVNDKLKSDIDEILRGREVNSYLTEVRNEIERITKNELEAKTRLERTIESKNKANEAKLQLETTVRILKSDREMKDKLLREQMSDMQLAEEELEQFYLSKEEQEKLKKEIHDYWEQKKYILFNLENLNNKLEHESKSNLENISDKVKQETEKNILLSEQIEQKTKFTAVLKENISRMQEDLVKLTELKDKHKKACHKLSLLIDLTELFSANKFVEFIAKRQLKYVVQEASIRLKEMTRSRYAIELDGTAFVIRDDHNGGAKRVPKTLSGGEIFMVSLCLALALSSKIQLKNNAPLQFFFLDEGFGTLDSSFLDNVMTTLEEFKTSKMTVGIISHVDEIRNRVPVKVTLIPAVEGISGTKVSID